MHDINKMQNEYKNPTTRGISKLKAGKGKSRSYNYGKLQSGCYNTTPLQEDLVPRSRTERNPDIRNGGDPHAPRWLLGRNGVTTSLSGI